MIVYTLGAKNYSAEIDLSHTVSEINAFYAEIPDVDKIALSRTVPKHLWQKGFFQKVAYVSGYTPMAKNFIGIALSRTVSKINALLHFSQKFKMAAKNGGQTIFGKKCHTAYIQKLMIFFFFFFFFSTLRPSILYFSKS